MVTFYDLDGQESFRIVDNVWEGPLSAWDIQVVGRKATIKTNPEQIALEFVVNPPSEIQITKLDMLIYGCHICCDENALYVGRVKNDRSVHLGLGRIEAPHSTITIDVDTTENTFGYKGLRIVGGEGIELQGMGIRIGVGSGAMNIRDVQVWET